MKPMPTPLRPGSRRRRLLLAALAVAPLAACLGPRQAPEVSLAGIDIESLGLIEQRYLLRLRVRNPNDMDIPLTGLAFDLDLAGQPFGKGLSNQAVTIPRLGEAVVEVHLTSNLGQFLKQFRDGGRPNREGVDYRVRGQALVSGYGSFPFDSKGVIPFPRIPGFDDRPPGKQNPGMV